jgi:uncharacterized protein (TIGR00290 family)
MTIPVGFCWSGGKDSAMALQAVLRDPEYEVVGLLTTVTEGFERISMHGVRRELLLAQAEALGLSLEEVRIPPQCPNTTYETRLGEAAVRLRNQGVRHVAFGDIFLRDLRAYREENLARLDMAAIFPLWDVDTCELAARFLREGFRAVTVCIDPKKLDRSFAGRELNAAFFRDLPRGVDPCGENGEFHTFVFGGPIFRSVINCRTGETLERDGFVFCDVLPVGGGNSHVQNDESRENGPGAALRGSG